MLNGAQVEFALVALEDADAAEARRIILWLAEGLPDDYGQIAAIADGRLDLARLTVAVQDAQMRQLAKFHYSQGNRANGAKQLNTEKKNTAADRQAMIRGVYKKGMSATDVIRKLGSDLRGVSKRTIERDLKIIRQFEN